MTRLIRIAVAVLIAVTVPLTASAAPSRTVIRAYSAPNPFAEPPCYLTPAVNSIPRILIGAEVDFSATDDVGGGCIPLIATDNWIKLVLDDDAGWTVSATVYFLDGDGRYIDDSVEGVCGERLIPIPRRARTAVVSVEASDVWCLVNLITGSGPATTGTIVATITS